jgi:hypothetical protein
LIVPPCVLKKLQRLIDDFKRGKGGTTLNLGEDIEEVVSPWILWEIYRKPGPKPTNPSYADFNEAEYPEDE